MQRYGTRYETEDERGLLRRVVDRGGAVHAELVWNGEQLVRLDVAGVTLHGEIVDDPLLGRAHRIGDTTISAIDWHRPTEIPAIAKPGALPPGSGRALMNVLAILAARANVPALRYAGPYPTAALFETLRRSFTTEASVDDFTRDFFPRAGRLARDPLPFDFVPLPHERLAVGGGIAELGESLQRWTHEGVTYSRDSSPYGIDGESSLHARIWLGDGPYARIASFTPDGELIDGPYPVRPLASSVIGQVFPPPLVAALSELIADTSLPVVSSVVREHVARCTFVWADLGVRLVHVTGDTVRVNAALWERVAPLGLTRLAATLVEVITPAVVNQAMLSLCASSP